MPPLVADQISCFDGGAEAFIRGIFAGGVIGAVFHEHQQPAKPSLGQQFTGPCGKLQRVGQRATSRLRSAGRYGYSMGAWNCKTRLCWLQL